MTIHITLPALNEEVMIEKTIRRVLAYCASVSTLTGARVIVADNGSTDRTSAIVRRIEEHEDRVMLVVASKRGKGEAVLRAWMMHPADVNIYMDADLSADISCLPTLVAALEHHDVAVGSRFVRGAHVERSASRLVLSRVLRSILFLFFRLHVRDAPCGVKAVRRRVIGEIVPSIEERGWFFDTELLIRAERAGYRIAEIPVSWSDIGDKERPSRVSPLRVITAYLRAIVRLRFSLRSSKY